MRTLKHQQAHSQSLVLTEHEELSNHDGDSPNCEEKQNIYLGDTETLITGPDIISHTTGAKHRRKIIAIPVSSEGDKAGAYRELSYSDSYHESFLPQPLGIEKFNSEK